MSQLKSGQNLVATGTNHNVPSVNGFNLKKNKCKQINITKVSHSNILREVMISNLLWNIALGH